MSVVKYLTVLISVAVIQSLKVEDKATDHQRRGRPPLAIRPHFSENSLKSARDTVNVIQDDWSSDPVEDRATIGNELPSSDLDHSSISMDPPNSTTGKISTIFYRWWKWFCYRAGQFTTSNRQSEVEEFDPSLFKTVTVTVTKDVCNPRKPLHLIKPLDGLSDENQRSRQHFDNWLVDSKQSEEESEKEK